MNACHFLSRQILGAALCAAAMVAGCASVESPPSTPTTPLRAATPGTLAQCTAISSLFRFPNTRLESVSLVNDPKQQFAGSPQGEHCLVKGKMHERVSPVDGQAYAIGFEMRLPQAWNGRFLYQGNGGTDGFVAPADGGFALGSGGLLKSALQMGFAIISSDAGHTAAQNPLFGMDPQARLDYGYQAVGKLTPMAKAVIQMAYGRLPDRSYIAGASNGGRHAMVAASRYTEHYDGFLANAPGIHLPRSAATNLSNVKRWDRVATTKRVNNQADLESALPKSERELIANAILAKCDALDGLADGLVQDIAACRTAFDLGRDVPTCKSERDGKTCLSALQKEAVALAYASPKLGNGVPFYTGFPFDPGLVQSGWAEWKFRSSVGNARNPVSVGFMFSSPPSSQRSMATDNYQSAAFAVAFDVDVEVPKLTATSGIYTESAMSFMSPPEATRLHALRAKGGKLLVVHGVADPIFSADDIADWFTVLDANHRGQAASFARLFFVPGMGHVRGGPATDQFDALSALVRWVEQGEAPDRLLATARGVGNRGGANAELPANWPANRSRPLCVFPKVARYQSGDPELANSFACS
jgi:feruloyl esterase